MDKHEGEVEVQQEVEAGVVPVWTLGDRLAKARHLAGLDQQEMADQLNVNRVTISRWEQGNNLAVRTILRWAEITGVADWWLLGLTGPDTASFVSSADQLSLLEDAHTAADAA